MKSPTVTLTRKEARQLVRLLGLLQDHLESAIGSVIVPGTNEPNPHCVHEVENVRLDRRHWKAAEAMVKRLCK